MEPTPLQDELSIDQLKTKTIKGLTLLVMREGAIKFIAIIGQLVLVRLLVPEFFGVVAVISFIVNIAELFTDVGLVASVIRNKERIKQSVLSSLFFVKFSLTAVAVVLLLVARPVLSSLFSALQPEHFDILTVFALTLLLRPLKTMILGLLERDLRYDIIPLVDIGGLIVYFVSAIALAANGYGVWSLVWSAVAKDIFEVMLLEFAQPFVPEIRLKVAEIKSHVRFGLPLQGNTLVGFLHHSTIPLLGGILLTPTAVGLLDWSFNAASLPRSISDNVGRIAFASFSRIQDETKLLTKAAEETIALLSLGIFFLLGGALLFGKDAIYWVIGSEWLAAAPALSWLLAAELFLALVLVLQQVVIARGLTKQLVIFSALALCFQWSLAFLLIKVIGFIGIPIAICCGWGLLALSYWYLARQVDVSISFSRAFLPQVIVFSVSTLMFYFIIPTHNSLPILIVWGILYTAVFTTAAWLIARSTLERARSIVRAQLGSFNK